MENLHTNQNIKTKGKEKVTKHNEISSVENGLKYFKAAALILKLTVLLAFSRKKGGKVRFVLYQLLDENSLPANGFNLSLQEEKQMNREDVLHISYPSTFNRMINYSSGI